MVAARPCQVVLPSEEDGALSSLHLVLDCSTYIVRNRFISHSDLIDFSIKHHIRSGCVDRTITFIASMVMLPKSHVCVNLDSPSFVIWCCVFHVSSCSSVFAIVGWSHLQPQHSMNLEAGQQSFGSCIQIDPAMLVTGMRLMRRRTSEMDDADRVEKSASLNLAKESLQLKQEPLAASRSVSGSCFEPRSRIVWRLCCAVPCQ